MARMETNSMHANCALVVLQSEEVVQPVAFHADSFSLPLHMTTSSHLKAGNSLQISIAVKHYRKDPVDGVLSTRL